MKNKTILIRNHIITVFLFTFVLSSCGTFGSISDHASAAAEHDLNIGLLEKKHKDCLAAAQTEEEKSRCEEEYQDELDKENENYANKQNSIKEIDKCEEFQRWVLTEWGYSDKDVKEIAKRHRSFKYDDYEFDDSEAISELLTDNLIKFEDKAAITKFEELLPLYGVSKDNAEQVMKQYYANDYYLIYGEYTKITSFRIGKDVYCNKEMLIEMGLIDDDTEDEEIEDEENNEVLNDYSTIPHETDTSITNETNSTYLDESITISKLSAAQYKLNETKLTAEQELELNKVIAFMQKWPDAKITIWGHTCSIGSDVANNTIGLNRAHQAKLYMVSQGIDANRIEELSKAATEPCASNDTEEGRMKNRRITFVVK